MEGIFDTLRLGTATGPTILRETDARIRFPDDVRIGNNSTGPLLRNTSANRLVVENTTEIILDSEGSGPAISRIDATSRFRFASSVRIGSATAPILSEDVGNSALQIGGNIDMTGNSIIMDDGGATQVQIKPTTGKNLSIANATNARTAIVSAAATAGWQVQSGRFTDVGAAGTITFNEAFLNAPFAVIITTESAGATYGNLTGIATTTGVPYRVTAAGIIVNWVAVGERA
jgi:hypothetical protein